MSVLRLLAFVLPLGLDDFAVAAALGATGMLSARDRLRVAVLFVVFEVGMPLIGLAAGAPLARAVGSIADYLAIAALAGLGLWMLVSGGGRQGGEERAARLGAARGFALIGLGISISLDELAIGFSLGLARLPVQAVIVAIAVQAFLAAQLGLLLGARIGERIREGAERVAGVALLALAAYLLAEHLASH